MASTNNSSSSNVDLDKNRKDLLIAMYNQMFQDIDRHIVVIWQSVGVIVGAFATFALVEKNIIPIDVAVSLIILLVGWSISHIYDSSYWYNRNLVIIANIERQFLLASDLRDIHYYFGKHRPHNAMITHLKIQYALGIGIVILITLYHIYTQILPGLFSPISNIDPVKTLPYVTVVVVSCWIVYIRKIRNMSYKEFLDNSPGKSIASEGVRYGVGHGYKSKE